jgi:hypothetical protein
MSTTLRYAVAERHDGRFYLAGLRGLAAVVLRFVQSEHVLSGAAR